MIDKINGNMSLKGLIGLLQDILRAAEKGGVHDHDFKALNQELIKTMDIEVADLQLNVYNLRKHPDDNPWDDIAEAEKTGN